jgi:hypothetical protein
MILKLNIFVKTDRPQSDAEAIKLLLGRLLGQSIRQTQQIVTKKLENDGYVDDWNKFTATYRLLHQELRRLEASCITDEEVLNTMRTKK